MKYGCRRTVATAMGNVTASVIQAGVSMAGLGAVLMASGTVFVLIKWCGAAYLIYTGITILRAPALNLEARSPIGAGEVNSAWHKRFMQAFWVAAGNPKAIVFFTALFPQFINTRGAHFEQLAVMVVTLAGIAFACFIDLRRRRRPNHPVFASHLYRKMDSASDRRHLYRHRRGHRFVTAGMTAHEKRFYLSLICRSDCLPMKHRGMMRMP